MSVMWKGGLAVALVAGIFLAGYWQGRNAGKREQLEDTIKAFEKRQEIDNEIDNLDAYRVCLELGGMPEQCAELRRMD